MKAKNRRIKNLSFTHLSLIVAFSCATPLLAGAADRRDEGREHHDHDHDHEKPSEGPRREPAMRPEFHAPFQAGHEMTPRDHPVLPGREFERGEIPHHEDHGRFSGERTLASREHLRQRFEVLNARDPRYFRVHTYCDSLLDAGYDPVVIDTWLDGLSEGGIIIGMPGDLLVNFYGEPVFRHEVIFEGAPAQIWGFEGHPGHVESVTIAHGKVVGVRR